MTRAGDGGGGLVGVFYLDEFEAIDF